ncbi:hypothetical protein M4I21_17675 [Cellulophaga sp. 20_2_10]|uniref:hypothetical protein n=1 Tax=Cellulophaga sp. 20_2_10 TaxID=2942476 RepID=UPI00201A66FE|nr:hypothetical protein [Cellulophaga sp. 20_2_10]MCL5247651.1 hypothetical protein [Cellulophaga sp. 20_2_10]
MRKLTYILYLLSFLSCSIQNKLTFKSSKIEKIEVTSRYLEENIEMQDNFKEGFIADLNKSIHVKIEENTSTHRILVYNNNGKVDTLLTDGYIYQNKKFHKSKENLIEKYSIEEINYLSDTVIGKLKTFEKLQVYLKEEEYDKLNTLFVEDVQWFFKEIREKDKKRFKRWCSLWAFDKVTYKSYVTQIINRKENLFDYENGEWKINQK